ncbi:phospholipase A2 [Streptomyces coacervatus]|nr:phospholipase A2 [Streptomyces coacervatus]MDF2269555.1 phospholipase A2 [Streptomyces coacervatus]
MGVATAALGVTGLGFASTTAYADSTPFNSDKFSGLMNEPLDTFAAQQNQHDANDSTPDADGMRWDRDGCSVPDSVASVAATVGQPLKGTAADAACNRHDAAYRTLQSAGNWNPNSHADADRRFAADLHDLQQAGKISEVQEASLALGAGLGSKLPSGANGLPAYDESTGSPYEQSGQDTSRTKRSLDDVAPPQEPDDGSLQGAGGPDPDPQEAQDSTAGQEQDLWGDDSFAQSDDVAFPAGDDGSSQVWGGIEER